MGSWNKPRPATLHNLVEEDAASFENFKCDDPNKAGQSVDEGKVSNSTSPRCGGWKI